VLADIMMDSFHCFQEENGISGCRSFIWKLCL
jgi:hypothetical protein